MERGSVLTSRTGVGTKGLGLLQCRDFFTKSPEGTSDSCHFESFLGKGDSINFRRDETR